MNKPPMIKSANRGELHENLGVPAGQKIPLGKLIAAKASDDPAVRKRATFALNFGHPGVVTGVSAHHNGKHATVHIVHGRRSPQKEGEPKSSYDDRPTSSVVLPKEHAAQLSIGQRVGVGVEPMEKPEELF